MARWTPHQEVREGRLYDTRAGYYALWLLGNKAKAPVSQVALLSLISAPLASLTGCHNQHTLTHAHAALLTPPTSVLDSNKKPYMGINRSVQVK